MSDKREKKSVVIALGYFDSVHIGHRKVIERAKALSQKLGVTLAVFTFKGNLKGAIFGENEKSVYTYNERLKILNGLGVKEIFGAPTCKTFLSLGRLAFLNKLNAEYDIKGYICGKDYKFGKNGSGNADYLIKYAKLHNQRAEIVDDIVYDGQRVSTTEIKNFIDGGKIEWANTLLGENFFISGKVVKGREVGRKIGFPTVNISVKDDKQTPADGVYKGHLTVFGKEYNAIVNCGNCPTFGVNEKTVEGHIVDFCGNLYGKEITLYFDRKIRDIVKFSSVEELKEQLNKDKQVAKEKE